MSCSLSMQRVPTPPIDTLSLHDALPIYERSRDRAEGRADSDDCEQALALLHRIDVVRERPQLGEDRKSTRLNSSHRCSSYAVFCLKKKKTLRTQIGTRPTARSRHRAAHD